jgi:hypothetical protein
MDPMRPSGFFPPDIFLRLAQVTGTRLVGGHDVLVAVVVGAAGGAGGRIRLRRPAGVGRRGAHKLRHKLAGAGEASSDADDQP